MLIGTEKAVDHTRYLYKRTLIVGDVNTGKTTFCLAILEAMCGGDLAARIAVVDLAPEIPESVKLNRGIKGVGGKLWPLPKENIVYLSASLVAPRLTSASEAEALEKARLNAQKIEALFRQYPQLERDILFINDISLALQAGTAEELIPFLASAGTIVANGYYGTKLAAGKLSQWELEQMNLLRSFFDLIISVPNDHSSGSFNPPLEPFHGEPQTDRPATIAVPDNAERSKT